MTLRFLLDEDLSDRVATGLEHRGVDAISIHTIRRGGFTDEEQLAFAVAEGRTLVTYNRGDFQDLDSQWRLEGREHAGILWCIERSLPRRDIGGHIRAIEIATQRYGSLANLCLPLSRPD